MRLRTLPLAVSGILMGSSLALLRVSEVNSLITLLALLTAVFLQVLSNLANDYGDFMKGTDNEKRLGNMRALQSGNISPAAMKRMIVLFVLLCLVSGIALLYVSAAGQTDPAFILFLLLGLTAIAAAIKYTVGKGAYGYSGWGDVFVFLFFGPVAVLGVYILHSGFRWSWHLDRYAILPAITVGLLSAGVLNTNNIRDIDNDRASGKNTLVVKMGLDRARMYHLLLIGVAFACMTLFLFLRNLHWIQYLGLLAFYPAFSQARSVRKTQPSPVFNAYLRQLSLGTLLIVMAFVILQTVAVGINASRLMEYLDR